MNDKDKKNLEKLNNNFNEVMPDPKTLNVEELRTLQVDLMHAAQKILHTNLASIKHALIKNNILTEEQINTSFKEFKEQDQEREEFVKKLNKGV